VNLTLTDFAEFYRTVNDDHTPFAWQQRLLDHLLTRRRWPERIAAPTGAGKTSAIDVHVFAVALTARDAGPRLPRRLAMVVDRRVLVDDQHERALALRDRLGRNRSNSPVVSEVAARLAELRWPSLHQVAPAQESPLVVGRLRGGAAASRSWRDHPTACAVLCATPEMWGSRLLFRGYGTASRAAAREAGLLAFDSAVVVDEAHLSRQLLVTARRVGHLATVAEEPFTDVPALQVVETTATPILPGVGAGADQPVQVSVEDSDLADSVLADRLTRPKPVRLRPVRGWPTSQPTNAIAMALAQETLGLLGEQPARSSEQAPTRTIGCFVNSVPMAIAVMEQLTDRKTGGQPVNAVMVCGQTRPADLDRLKTAHQYLLTPVGDDRVDVIVATQSLEVGVDLDLAAIVTELASGSALAQRAGRVNRRGLRDSAPIVVAVPDGALTGRSHSGPYAGEELVEALQWVRRRADDTAGMAPWPLRTDPPPPAARRRRLFQRPELADAWHWARTSDELAADPQLDLWLADSFDTQTPVEMVVRDRMPATVEDAVDVIRALPPRPHEMFHVPLNVARSVLAELLSGAADGAAGDPAEQAVVEGQSTPSGGGTFPPVVRVRGEEIVGLSAPDRVRPGDVLVIDSSARIFTSATPTVQRPLADGSVAEVLSPQVVVALAADDEKDGLIPTARHQAQDVLHWLKHPGPGAVVLRLEFDPDGPAGEGPGDGVSTGRVWPWISGIRAVGEHQPLRELADIFADLSPLQQRSQVAAVLRRILSSPHACRPDAAAMVGASIELLNQRAKDSEVIVQSTNDGSVRILVLDRRRAWADEDLRQVYTASDKPVTLNDHQAAVAARAHLLASRVGLQPSLAFTLRWAGRHHDDGKQDARFQRRLGASPGVLLAKSDPTSTVADVRRREVHAGLPRGWRHEQRSVVDSWASSPEPDLFDPGLASRLVGTSHGAGRVSFPIAGKALFEDNTGPAHELAVHLFDEGGWDALIEATHLRHGVWSCAYLEALLRAADGQVSGEGT
jgi:CRISPR-associated endonuclease/helicase Cas3